MSKGEQQIAQILSAAGIVFEQEKRFSDLKHGLFRYDFYIKDLNGSPAIIEVNGAQHYKYIKQFFKTQKEWRKAQENDRRKISYALANSIPIYIIPFWELPRINCLTDIIQPQHLATSRWKNDEEVKNMP